MSRRGRGGNKGRPPEHGYPVQHGQPPQQQGYPVQPGQPQQQGYPVQPGAPAGQAYSSPTGFDPGQRQLPILCKNCMGPATPSLDGAVVCDFCGARDQLPADQLARALELKSRLTSAKNSVANVSGMENALSEIFEKRSAFWSVAGIYIVAGIVMTGFSWLQARPIIEAAPEGIKTSILLNSLMGGMYMGGIAISLLVSLAVGRFLYRRNVRTQLFARVPRQEGLPARCRACDGSLADRRTPFILCDYCGTKNLVTKELQANRQMLLEREREFYAQRTGQALGGMRGASIKMSRVLVVCGVLVYVAIIGLAAFASSTISTG